MKNLDLLKVKASEIYNWESKLSVHNMFIIKYNFVRYKLLGLQEVRIGLVACVVRIRN